MNLERKAVKVVERVARVAAVELPGLPFQVFRRDRPALAGQCVAVVEGAAGRERVCAVSPEAEAAGIGPGQPLAEARAQVAGLVVLVRAVQREVEALARLAELLLGLAPFVELAPPEALLLDASAAPLAAPDPLETREGKQAVPGLDDGRPGAERTWGALVVETLREQGFTARVAVADTPEAARLLVATAEVPVRVVPPLRARGLLAGVPLGLVARLCDDVRRFQKALDAGGDGRVESKEKQPDSDAGQGAGSAVVVPPGEAREAAARLFPPIDGEAFGFVHQLGLKRLGDLDTLPARALGHRLGLDGTRLLALASGGKARPLTAFWPQLPLVERLDLETGVSDAAALQFAVRPLVERLGSRLERRGLAASKLRLSLELEAAYRTGLAEVPESPMNPGGYGSIGRPRRRTLALPVELARPATSAATLVSVVRERLGALPVTAPVVACVVEVLEHAPRGAQLALGQRPQALDALEGTLARLTARLGETSVGALRPVPVWEPEKGRTRVPFKPDLGRSLLDAAGTARSPSPSATAWRRVATRPSRLFVPEPVSIDWDPLGRPAAVTFRTRRHRVVDWSPPERLWAGWWRAEPVDDPDEIEAEDSEDVTTQDAMAEDVGALDSAAPATVDEPLARNAHGDPEKPKKRLESTSSSTAAGAVRDRPSGHESARDYAAWLLDDGVRLWLFRDASARWWAHGVFD